MFDIIQLVTLIGIAWLLVSRPSTRTEIEFEDGALVKFSCSGYSKRDTDLMVKAAMDRVAQDSGKAL